MLMEDKEEFSQWYVAKGGSPTTADTYARAIQSMRIVDMTDSIILKCKPATVVRRYCDIKQQYLKPNTKKVYLQAVSNYQDYRDNKADEEDAKRKHFIDWGLTTRRLSMSSLSACYYIYTDMKKFGLSDDDIRNGDSWDVADVFLKDTNPTKTRRARVRSAIRMYQDYRRFIDAGGVF